MKEFIADHFTDITVVFLIIVFAGLTLHILHSKESGDDAFKWAAGIVGTLVGALLMRMRGAAPALPNGNGNGAGKQ